MACPITRGNDTVLSEDSARVFCARNQAAAREKPEDIITRECITCKGKRRPPELKIKDLRGESIMPSKQKQGDPCEQCGKNGVTVKQLYNQWVCNQCHNAMIECKLRPDNVIFLLKKYHPEKLTGSPGENNGPVRQLVVDLERQNEELRERNAKLKEKISNLQRLEEAPQVIDNNEVAMEIADLIIAGKITGFPVELFRKLRGAA